MVALLEAIAGRRPNSSRPTSVCRIGMNITVRMHSSMPVSIKRLVRNLLSSGDTRLLGFRWIRAWTRSRSLTVDAYVYTGLAKVVTVSPSGKVVQSRHDLKIRPETSLDAAKVDRMLPPPRLETPALVIERELANIAWHYDGPTAELTALVLEYPQPSHRQGVDLLAAPKIRD